MSYLGTALATVTCISVLLPKILATADVNHEPVWERMEVGDDGLRFNLAFSSGNSRKIYWMKLFEDGVQSIYTFQADRCLTGIQIGPESYKPEYNPTAQLVDVVRLEGYSPAENGEEDVNSFEVGSVFGNHHVWTCDACIATWGAVCREGVPCICSLLNHKAKLSSPAAESFETMCKAFGKETCSNAGGFKACSIQCKGLGPPVETAPDPALELYLPTTAAAQKKSLTGTGAPYGEKGLATLPVTEVLPAITFPVSTTTVAKTTHHLRGVGGECSRAGCERKLAEFTVGKLGDTYDVLQRRSGSKVHEEVQASNSNNGGGSDGSEKHSRNTLRVNM